MDTDSTILIERPYAAVLEDEFAHFCCSNCFRSKASFPCPKQCGFANYCDEKCSKEDLLWHQFECAGFVKCKQENRKPNVESRARIVARILARLRYDKGIVSLSDRCPDYVKDRQYGELLSHYEDFKKDPWSAKRMQTVMEQFFDFFAPTPLKDTTAKEFRVTFCVYRTNSFGISTSKGTMGLALYLNTSRFNHSCNPTAKAIFDGNRAHITVRSHVLPDEYATEHRFNQLTIDYGTINHAGRGYYITTTRQRIDSLKSRYFFRCLCTMCVDSIAALIEERSANVECDSCHIPYVWTKKGQLRQLCQCQPRKLVGGRQRKQVLKLEKQWKEAMDLLNYVDDPVCVARLCEPLLKSAQTLWHNSENWRLAQVVEALAVAYASQPELVEDRHTRAECFDSLACYYDRIDRAYTLATKYRELAEAWKRQLNGGLDQSSDTA